MKYIAGLAVVSALAASVRGSGTDPETSHCCSSLAAELGPAYHDPSSAEFEGLVSARWSGTSVLRPGCVVRPASSHDVSRAVRVLARGRCRFAVKGGGHNANPGANSIAGGVSVDLGLLRGVRIAPDRTSVSLGAGVTWGLAYDRANNTGLGFTGGVCEDVGVGGPTMGGGQSLFQAKRGWAVDNILAYELVLASGDVVVANQTSRPDLFKALNGGNTNFGIVTRVDFAAFDQGTIWGGEIRLNLNGKAKRAEMLDRVCNATVNFIANNNVDVDTGLQVSTAYLMGNKGEGVELVVTNGVGDASAEAAQPFLRMPNQIKNTVRHLEMADFVHELSKAMPKGFREVTATVTIDNDYKTLRAIVDATDKVYHGLRAKDQVDWLVQFFPQPKIQQSYSARRGGNSLGLEHVKNDQIVLWFTTRWKDPKLDGMVEDAREDFIRVAEAVARKHGTLSPFLYINYAAYTQNPLCGYGAESVAFLKKTALKYDPDGVFQKLMPGGFKISKANCSHAA